MAKLFLLRYRRQDIHGPFNTEDMNLFLQKYETLSDWEVSGNLEPWVFLSHSAVMKNVYPQLWQDLN